MGPLLPIGRAFFALALVGLGVEHFIFGTFVTGRAPAWPEAVPGGAMWTYLTGLAFIAIGCTIIAGKWVRSAALFAAVLIATGALLRHIPIVAAAPVLSGAWTQAGKALTFTGGALAAAATSPPRGRESIVIARICLGVFLLVSGIQHFLFMPFVVTLIPTWFPGNPAFWGYFAGVALIAGGIGLFVPLTARVAAALSGMMVFSWFWIVHVPRTFVSVSDGIALFEALAFAGVAWMIAGYLSR